jgi:hypothetical protein
VWAQEIEHGAIPFAEVTAGAVEFEARISSATGIEPQPEHVFDAERARDLAIEPETVKLAPREEVRVLPCTVDRGQHVLMPIPLARLAHIARGRAARLPGPDDLPPGTASPFVVGDDVTRHEPPKGVQHRLGKRGRPVDGRGLAYDLEHLSSVGFREADHPAQQYDEHRMAETAGAGNHSPVRKVRVIALGAAVLVTALVANGATATNASRAAPASFRLVFEGRHNADLLHEGLFTTSASFCPSGAAADISIDSATDTSVRQFSCGGSAGQFTARVTPLPAEHGGIGSWQIVDGTGPLADLRGKGTWSSTRIEGRPDNPASIVFRSTWDGVADFDVSPPTIGVSSSSARKLSRPKGAYALRLVVVLSDAGGGDRFSYILKVADPRKPLNFLAYKTGETTMSKATFALRVRPAKRTRVLRLEIDASDAVGNESTFAKTLRLG